MEELFRGARQFVRSGFKEHEDLYTSLELEQRPHTLFISCSDSRIVPNLLTKSRPGDLFIIRNIANVVPYYRKSEEFLATTSAVEYAVKVLEVANIVVCGHSNCGGCKALYAEETLLSQIPQTRRWLELAEPVKRRIAQSSGGVSPSMRQVAEENVILQIEHLHTYPYISDRYTRGEINILGWYYEIGSGDIYNLNHRSNVFEKIE